MDTSKRKPDLMGTSSAQTDGAKRILAHLEHGARLPASKPARTASWAIDGWTVGLGLLLLAMCGIAWLMHDRTVTPNSYKAGYSSAPRYEHRDEILQARAQPSDAQAEPAEGNVEPTDQAAAIVNDPVPPRTHTMEGIAAMPAHGGGATSRTLSARAAATSSPGPATPPMDATRVASTGATPAKPSATGAVNKHNSGSGAGAARAQPATTTASRGKAAAPANDTDVALLTALVAHSGKPTVVAPERSRDIVERREGDSTAELLARCKQLGLIEGMLCRSRICSGRWESDATCRAPAL